MEETDLQQNLSLEMEMILPDDHLLAESISLGDEAAFTSLYEKYHAFLFHFSFRYLKSAELAEEAVHDVFLKIWEKRGSINPAFSIKGYLIKICRNHVLNLMHRNLREQAWKSKFESLEIDLHSETEDEVILADYVRLAEEAIAALPPQRQRIFRLYRLEEMTLDEIAVIAGISKGTVKDHLLRATRQVKDFLRKYSGIPIESLFLFILSWL